MVPRSRVGRASTILLALYLACVVLVFSFILFEVLDIDGSDFPVAPARTVTPAHPAESSHDIKRAHLQNLTQLWADLEPPSTDRLDGALCLQRAARLAPAVASSPASLAHRITLARSSLLDPPASA